MKRTHDSLLLPCKIMPYQTVAHVIKAVPASMPGYPSTPILTLKEAGLLRESGCLLRSVRGDI